MLAISVTRSREARGFMNYEGIYVDRVEVTAINKLSFVDFAPEDYDFSIRLG